MSQTDKVDQAGEHLEEATEDVGRGLRWYAKAYLTVLFFGIVGFFVAALWVGFIDLNLTLTASVSVGWVVEYLIVAVAAVFVIWTAAMVLVALPGSFISGVVSAIARIADAYQMPDDDE